MKKRHIVRIISDEEKRLVELIKISPISFLNEYFEYSKEGKLPDVFKYVQLKILKNRGELLTQIEEEKLEILNKKYNNLNVDYLENYSNESKRIPTLKKVKQDLKEISENVVVSVRKAHERKPQKGYASFLEYVKALSKNIREDRGIKYNLEGGREIIKYFNEFKTKEYRINNELVVKLKSKSLIHILVGHIEKYSIPRKGKMVMFSRVENWKELLVLLDNVIQFLSESLVQHYTNNETQYDNYDFEYQGISYGIHLNKKAEIKTFYEIKHKC